MAKFNIDKKFPLRPSQEWVDDEAGLPKSLRVILFNLLLDKKYHHNEYRRLTAGIRDMLEDRDIPDRRDIYKLYSFLNKEELEILLWRAENDEYEKTVDNSHRRRS
jgi:hypothetical protein